MQTYDNVIPLENERFPIPQWMQMPVLVIIAEKKNKKNPLHDKSGRVCFVVFTINDVEWLILWSKDISQQPVRVTGSYTYWHVAGKKKKQSMWFSMYLGRF